jgi:glyoxylase-like metal-dependent hydrolase (beta-lactamase superfamily II)
MRKTSLLIALLLWAFASHAQEMATSVKSSEVVPGIYLIEGADGFAGGNITLLVGDDQVVLIDDGVEPIAAALIESVADVAGRPVDFVINTHVHGDHVGSNAAFANTGAVVVAHDNIRKRLETDPTEAGGPDGLPQITFSNEVTFHAGGHTAKVFHIAAAHTDGDAAILFPEVNVIHAGDIHFNYLFPFIDLDNGGSVAGFITGQRRIIDLADDDTIIIPGHGPLASKADLQVAVDMLVDAEARVRKLVNQGKTQDEVIAANPLAIYHDKWNWGFITTEVMTTTLYRSLMSNAD